MTEGTAATELTGRMIIAGTPVSGTGERIRAVHPSTGAELAPAYGWGTPSDVDRACAAAEAAFDEYRATTPQQRAVFLETIADRIEALGDALPERAHSESGLPI